MAKTVFVVYSEISRNVIGLYADIGEAKAAAEVDLNAYRPGAGFEVTWIDGDKTAAAIGTSKFDFCSHYRIFERTVPQNV